MMVSLHRCQYELTVQVRHIGVSNESSWGVCQWGNAAEKYGLPKIVSIQNSYSLLVRHPGTLYFLPGIPIFVQDNAALCAHKRCC